MGVKLTPAEAREKHARRLKGALADMERGIRAVTEAPGAKAAKHSDKWLARLTAPETKAKWERRIGGVPLAEWQEKFISKGLPRVPAGVDAAADKIEKFYDELFAFQDGLKAKVEAMPDLTLEDSVNRSAAWIRGMAKFERKS